MTPLGEKIKELDWEIEVRGEVSGRVYVDLKRALITLDAILHESYTKHAVVNDDGSQSNHWPKWARGTARQALKEIVG